MNHVGHPSPFLWRIGAGSGWRRRWPLTLLLGLAIIAACESLLFIDVVRRGWLVEPLPPGQGMPDPEGPLGRLARLAAFNMTVACWVAFLLVFDGLLTRLAWKQNNPHISSIRTRPNRFVFTWLTSIPVWCFFDWINFHFMDAWRYHGLPDVKWERFVGYFIAFAAISPGMFLAAQWFQFLGFSRLNTRGVRITRPIQVAVFVFGIAFVAYPFIVRDPIANLTLWVSLIFLLDPVNFWAGAPSIIGDWREGRWGRTLALMAGGALCGLLWEFWNYWALTKWTYHLPFVGSWEKYRYFEMPWIGFQGFLPFAVECWVVLNTMLMVMRKMGLEVAEPLPDAVAVL